MTIILTLFALSFFLLEGFLLVCLLEGKHHVLSQVERLSYGFLLGCALFSYAALWLVLIGIPLSFIGLLIVHVFLLLLLGGAFFWRFGGFGNFCKTPFVTPGRVTLSSPSCSEGVSKGGYDRATQGDTLFPHSSVPELKSRWIQFLIAWCVVWTLAKVIIGGYDLLSTPAYFNDTYASWNMRAKVFFVEESFLLGLKPADEYFFGGRVPSYPLTVHLSKVWIAKAVGDWNEISVNSIHLFWFLALLGIFFGALKRELNLQWAIAGTAALVSLPLVLVHGVNAYSDVLMAGFVFAALHAFYRWMILKSTKSEIRNPNEDGKRRSWLLVFGVMTAGMIFVKNEALLIFVPTITVLFGFMCWMKGNPRSIFHFSDFAFRFSDFLMWLLIVSSVAVPWTLFKWFEGLTFGNATEVSGFSLKIHEGVAFAVEGDLLYTGSYLLFFPLFALLLFMGFGFYVRKSLGALVAFFLIVFFGEFCIYLLTPLATEAIRHTGFGRGMVHILPVGVFVGIFILSRFFDRESLSAKEP